MTVPQRPLFPRPTPRARGGGSVLAVGRRVLVKCPSGATGRATLTDVKGATPLATLPHGAEVEILGWQPRHAGGTRYWIRSAEQGVEGWVGGENLCVPTQSPVPDGVVGSRSPSVASTSPKGPPSAAVPARSGERAPTKATRRPR
jgi:hypothetical protein